MKKLTIILSAIILSSTACFSQLTPKGHALPVIEDHTQSPKEDHIQSSKEDHSVKQNAKQHKYKWKKNHYRRKRKS